MSHKVTYAALTATAIISSVEAQVQMLADAFTPAAYPIVVAIVSIIGIAVRAWKDWQSAKDHAGQS